MQLQTSMFVVQVMKRLPGLKRLDGALIDSDEREAAIAAQNAATT